MTNFKTIYGKAIIREAKHDDYPSIVALMSNNELQIPIWSEIEKLSMIAIVNDKIVAFIWACVGNCTTAYLDHLIVDRKYRDDKDSNMSRTTIGIQLCMEMFRELMRRGTTRLVCTLMDDIYGKCMARAYDDLGFTIVQSLGVARGNLCEITSNLIKRVSNEN